MRIGEFFRYELTRGEPFTAGGVEIVPHARVTALRTPYGGWVWNRPVALAVRREGEGEKYIPIFDATLVGTVLLYGLSIVLGGLSFVRLVQKRRSQ